MFDYWIQSLREGYGSSAFDGTMIYAGLTALGWLGWAYCRRQDGADPRRTRWMFFATGSAVFLSLFGELLGPFMPFLIGLQAFVVMPVLAHSASLMMDDLLHAFHGLGSPIPDLSGARHAMKTGRTEEAIQMALVELGKDPVHYEANYLLAQIYWETEQPKLAFFCLFRLLDNQALTPEQRRQAEAEFDQAFGKAQQRGWIDAGLSRSELRRGLPTKLPGQTDRDRVD